MIACNSEPSSLELIIKVDGNKMRPKKPGQKSICMDELIHKSSGSEIFLNLQKDTLWERLKPGEGSSSTGSYVQ